MTIDHSIKRWTEKTEKVTWKLDCVGSRTKKKLIASVKGGTDRVAFLWFW